MLRGPVGIVGQPWLRRSLLAAVAAALVFTQAIGLHHRIDHSAARGWTGGAEHGPLNHAVPADPASQDHHAGLDTGTAEHHCEAIDALALGDGPPMAKVHAEVSPPAISQAVDRPQPFANSSILRAFEARAPPAFFS